MKKIKRIIKFGMTIIAFCLFFGASNVFATEISDRFDEMFPNNEYTLYKCSLKNCQECSGTVNNNKCHHLNFPLIYFLGQTPLRNLICNQPHPFHRRCLHPNG